MNNLAEYLFRRAQSIAPGEKTAIFFGERTITYDELYRLTAKCSGVLRSLGVNEGDRVAMIMRDCPPFIFTFLGAARIGAIAVPINPALPPPELRYVLDNCGAKVAVITDEQLTKLQTISGDLPALEKIVVVGQDESGARCHLARPDFDKELEAADEVPLVETKSGDPAFILYSSGSTGFPKGAIHLHRDIPYTVETFIQSILQVQPEDRLFSSSRLFFAYGLGNSLSSPIGCGASIVLTSEKPTPEIITDIFQQFRPTIFFAVPAVYRAVLQHQAQGHKLDVGSLRFCFSAGEKLPAQLYHEWTKTFGVELMDGLGTTEMLHVFLCNRLGDVRPGCSGRPVPGYEVKLVDNNDHEIEGEGVGNLLVRGGSMMAGYWNNPEKTAAALCDGWLRTGDVYRRDAEGYYWYEGRSDDVFKVKGLWVSPIEVEDVLLIHPDILEAAVISGQDHDGMTTVVAYVVSKTAEPSQEFVERVKAHASARLPAYKCPAEVRLVDQLPRTATGKVQRFKLRETYGQ
jgi:benzoate-CoA ligase